MDETRLNEIIKDVVLIMSYIMDSVGLSSSRIKASGTVTTNGYDFSINLNDYAIFIDKGRRKGAKRPPLYAIIDWMRRNGITPRNGMSEQSLAFIIARNIGIRGIKARPFLDNLQKEATELIELFIFEEINSKLKESLKLK